MKFYNKVYKCITFSISQCRSESSRSEDISSCEEEEDFFSLSPSSSFSCPRPTHCGPQLDDTAPSDLPVDENHFLSGNPARWSVEEVCQFISSLQGQCSDATHDVCFVFSYIFTKLFNVLHCDISCQVVRTWHPSSCHRRLMGRHCCFSKKNISCPL